MLAAAGVPASGELWVVMLDSKATFDDLVRAHASSPHVAETILRNPIYRHLSSSLAGTQEYMAMEKLHAVQRDASVQSIVLDTPPTSNALDFLRAPQMLVEAIDSPAMRWLGQLWGTANTGLRSKLLSKGASMMLQGMARFTGAEFLTQVAEFVRSLNDLFGGFQTRAKSVYDSLRSAETGFWVVTSPTTLSVAEALRWKRHLAEAGMRHDGFVVNGVRRVPDALRQSLHAGGVAGLRREIRAELRHTLADEQASQWADRLGALVDMEQKLAHAHEACVTQLHDQTDARQALVTLPALDEDVHDIAQLWRLSQRLHVMPPRTA
jgi:anion-transporting  ArsA/GET3 family ATPase